MYLIDGGVTLGTNYQKYKETFFYPTDYKQYNWALHRGADREISLLVKKLIHVVPDYTHSLPPIHYHPIYCTPPPEVQDFYDSMRKDMCVGDVVAVNAAVLTLKLQQVANGWAYDDEGLTVRISNFKATALLNFVDTHQEPLIVVYWFKEDLQTLRQALPGAVELDPRNPQDAVDRWNAGEIDFLLLHPRSAGHGINLAAGGSSILWFGPQWSRDLWEQTNARLWRRGQKNPVHVYTLIASGTVDEAVAERFGNKAKFEKMLLEHLTSI